MICWNKDELQQWDIGRYKVTNRTRGLLWYKNHKEKQNFGSRLVSFWLCLTASAKNLWFRWAMKKLWSWRHSLGNTGWCPIRNKSGDRVIYIRTRIGDDKKCGKVFGFTPIIFCSVFFCISSRPENLTSNKQRFYWYVNHQIVSPQNADFTSFVGL